MSKITAEMWEKAISKINRRTAMVQESRMFDRQGRLTLGEEAYLHLMATLQDRYDDGERSIELYNAIMELC